MYRYLSIIPFSQTRIRQTSNLLTPRPPSPPHPLLPFSYSQSGDDDETTTDADIAHAFANLLTTLPPSSPFCCRVRRCLVFFYPHPSQPPPRPSSLYPSLAPGLVLQGVNFVTGHYPFSVERSLGQTDAAPAKRYCSPLSSH